MSDIREHYNDQDIDSILDWFAKEEAKASGHEYTKVPDFQPHEWVKKALKRAYSRGKSDGREELQKSLRSLIGSR